MYLLCYLIFSDMIKALTAYICALEMYAVLSVVVVAERNRKLSDMIAILSPPNKRIQ